MSAGASVPFDLRPGRAEDFDFARALYMSSMKPLLQALGAWDPDVKEIAFKTYFEEGGIRVITREGRDVGWIQVSQTDQEFCLDQLHLVEAARNQGIGTALIKATIAEASEQGKNVSLSLVKGNRAIKLYKRLGFHQVAEDETKIHKRFVTGDD